MPAKSVAQQRLFGMALAVKRGELLLSDIDSAEVRKAVNNITNNMTESDIKKFAKTDHDGLPEKIDEEGEATLGSVVGDSGDGYLPDGSNKKRELSDAELKMLYLAKKAEGKLDGVTFKEFKKKMKEKAGNGS